MNKPNCSTCKNAVDTSKPGTIVYRCKVDGQFLWELQFNYLCEHGCLDHPGAREYLMTDVIKELEKKYSEAESHCNLTETYDRLGRWQYATRMDAWRYALTLIRGDGK